MSTPVVIIVFGELLWRLLPILIYGIYIVCSPQYFFKWIKTHWVTEDNISNIIQLTLFLCFQAAYLTVYFNIHLMLIIYYVLEIHSTVTLVLSYIVLMIFYSICYKILDMKFSFVGDIRNMLYYLSYTFIYLIIFICCVIRFGNTDLYRMISFNYLYFDILELWAFGIFTIFETMLLIFIHLLCIIHLITPLSLIRIVSIIKNERSNGLYIAVFLSTIYIFQDILLLLAYFFNMLFIPSFLKSHIKLLQKLVGKSSLFNNDHEYDAIISSGEKTFSYANSYFYIKYILIWKHFVSNIKLLLGIIFTVVSLLFFWRAMKTVRNLQNLYMTSDFKEFSINFTLNIVEGLIDTIFPIIFIYNHLNPFNGMSLYRAKQYYSTVIKIDYPFSILNLVIFIQKGFDYLVTALSLTRFCNFTFIMYCLRLRREGRWSEMKFFPLMVESDSFIKQGREEFQLINDEKRGVKDKVIYNDGLLKYLDFFYNRRLMLFKWTVYTNVINILLLLSLPTIFDPFYGIKLIKDIYYYSYDSQSHFFNRGGSAVNTTKMFEWFSARLMMSVACGISDFFFFLPVNVLLNVTGPWNIYGFVKYCYFRNIKDLGKFKKNRMNLEDNYYALKINGKCNALSSNYFHTKTALHNWYRGWIIIIQFTIIHMTILRAIFLWRDFFRFKKNKTEREATTNVTVSDTHKFVELIDKHVYQAVKEFIFIPFLIPILLLTPWSVFKVEKFFFKATTFEEKFWKLLEIAWEFIIDLFTMLNVIIILLSLINTVSCLKLLFYSFKATFLQDQESLTDYETFYKGDFKSEVRALSSGIIRKIFILFLLVLNCLLIIRIPHLYRRVMRFFRAALAYEKAKFKKLFNPPNHLINETDTDKHSLSTLGNSCLCSIFEFLPPGSIANLAQSCTTLSKKTKLNLVWKNMYIHYYDKKLKDVASIEAYNLFNPENYGNYMIACQKAGELICTKQVALSEEERDSLIGLVNVLLEESVDSLLGFPHLLLIPAKIIAIPILYVHYSLEIVHQLFYMSTLYNNYLWMTFIPIFDHRHFPRIDFTRETFYAIQAEGLFSLLMMIVGILGDTVSTVYSLFLITVKVACLTTLRVPAFWMRYNYEEKIIHSRPPLVIYQMVLTFLVLILHFILLSLPFYYFHGEGLRNLLHQHFLQDSSLAISLTSPSSYIGFIDHAIQIWWDQGFFGRIYYLMGSYCTNIIVILLNMLVVFFLYHSFSSSDVFIYDILFTVFIPRGHFINFLNRYFLYICKIVLFPQVYLIAKLNRFFSVLIQQNFLASAFINILSLIGIVFPFYLNFKITLTIFRFVMLNVYGIVNVVMLVKYLSR